MPIETNPKNQQTLAKYPRVINQLIDRFINDQVIAEALAGPTSVSNHSSFSGLTLKWEKDFTLHRINAPALMIFDKENNLRIVEWYLQGKLESQNDLPSRCTFYCGGAVHTQEWHTYNELHRHHGPAYLEFDPDGQLTEIRYSKLTGLHNSDGPALLRVNHDGTTTAAWFENGKLHNTSGPAVVIYSHEGAVLNKCFYINGAPPEPLSYPRSLFEKTNFSLDEITSTSKLGGNHA